MKEELKAYCEKEYNQCWQWNGDVEKAIDRCYGAVMFVLNYTERYDDSIAEWWDDEMLPKFRKLERKK